MHNWINLDVHTPAESNNNIKETNMRSMDQRQTFMNAHQLFSFVQQIFQQKQHAALLIDKEGLTRAEGMITSINLHDNIDETSIMIDDNVLVLIKEIIGINGLFRSDYSEC
jgi:hypothetical protein